MKERRLIDASGFDELILPVPEDVFDAESYIRGVEDVLSIVRITPTVKSEIDIIVDGRLSVHTEV